jgi:hypothetical protein
MNNRLVALVAAVQAVLGALVLLGWVNLTDEQIAGVMTAVNALVLAVAAWFEPAIPIGPSAPPE